MTPHVLVVENDSAAAHTLCGFFSALGGLVDWARDRLEAERRLDEQHYDAVIVNLHLVREPRGGLTVAWRARRTSPAARIVLLTLPHESPALEKQARACGVNIIIHKPRAISEVVRGSDGDARMKSA